MALSTQIFPTNRNMSFEQIRENLIINQISEENQRLYFGDSKGVNYYAILTNFYVNALWGQYPKTSAPMELLTALDCSTIQRSINGVGAVVKYGETYEAVSTRYYWRAIDLNTGRQNGHVLMFPFSSAIDQRIQQIPNRIRVITYREGEDTIDVSTYQFSGSTLGSRLSQEIASNSAIIAWGDGINDYDNVKFLVGELNKRLTKNSALLDRHSSPHIQGPASAIRQDGSSSRFEFDTEGSYLPMDGDGSVEYKYLTWDSQQALSQFTISKVVDLLHLQTGIPVTAFGIQGASTSGISLERQMFAALSKVRRWRRSIEMALKDMGIEDLEWVIDPFAGWNENINSEAALVNARIISPETAAERLGIPSAPPPVEDEENQRDNEEEPTE